MFHLLRNATAGYQDLNLDESIFRKSEIEHPKSEIKNRYFYRWYMTDDSFAIHLPQFEGPFDLLLFFIERDELDIHDIPIAKIADDFLNYIHQMTSLNMELASEFIFVAATLMRIKAKMLLPRYEAENAADDTDTKENLIRKLDRKSVV